MILLFGLNIVSFVVILYQYMQMGSLNKKLLLIEKRNRLSRFLISNVLKMSNVEEYLKNSCNFTKDELIKLEALRYVEDCLLTDVLRVQSTNIDITKLHFSVRSYFPEIKDMMDKGN
ncbi:hypothetical protein MZM67_002448 [Enterococcus faecium]|uniref:hypothetical protein n=1 Tax=Enterococcus sp. (strain 3G1_DIV0629) TaxID=1834176 RepID=UPI000A32C065|nr:hypothetical protein [Enterococcus sp. 3G1_DIV0629]EME7220756.1 hypothetical protein [Enterococcus faecium]EME8112458.1 hypothetical protein [Enterococcus faecium]EME8123199.1 hypothetical protein [Enterococcus faecium]OTO28499.1 hypothetical protein A5816_000767 [Enterococcus sp. 3G1_DIV0629]